MAYPSAPRPVRSRRSSRTLGPRRQTRPMGDRSGRGGWHRVVRRTGSGRGPGSGRPNRPAHSRGHHPSTVRDLERPTAVRDPPNTFVRGRPAALSELTAEANNADLLTFHWQDPVVEGLTEPLSGLWLSAEAHPRRHSVEDIRRFI